MSVELKTNDSAAHAPEEVMKWVRKLLDAQDCPGVLSRETSGYHLYIPCPDCLHTHGRKELDDPKYSINLSIVAGLGEYREEKSAQPWMPGAFEAAEDLAKRKEFRAGICMRTRSSREPHIFSLERLTNMSTVTERHPDILTKAALHGNAGSAEREEMWEEDPESGISCPPPAGDRVPLSSLPPKHPAVAYLTDRGYYVGALEEQFHCSFCTKEYPYGEKQIFYRKMPGGWKDSPQHRVIFHSLIDGAPLTWQARVIEKVSDDELTKLQLHPYAGGFYPGADLMRSLRSFKSAGHDGVLSSTYDEGREGYWLHMWSPTHTRSNPKATWMPLPPFDEVKDGTLKFRPSKYRTAKYSSRQMMGWDAAVKRADEDQDDIKWVVLCEGPLDSARVGPGGIALIGSSISQENAGKIAGKFHMVFLAFDADKAGREATEKITKILMGVKHRAPLLVHIAPLPVPTGKDLGDMTDEEYKKMFNRVLKRSKRNR